MKTAVQEAIAMVRSRIETIDETLMGKHSIHHLQQVERDLYDLLEKEKEQIIEASNNVALKSMVHREKLDTMSEDELRDSLVEDTISYGEEYYNQTYNQNK
jgi:rRNA-processing protein FCF1